MIDIRQVSLLRPVMGTLQRFFGRLPTAVLPFDEVQNLSDNDHLIGVQRLERPIGVLRTASGTADILREADTIYGECLSETISGKRRYFHSSLQPRVIRRAYVLSDGGVLGHCGVIYQPSSRIAIQETIREWVGGASQFLKSQPMRRTPPIPLSGITIVLAAKDSQGFYHFLFDLLTRVFLLKEELESADHILVSGPKEEWRIDWLRTAGVRTEKVIWLDDQSHFVCDQVAFCDYPTKNLAPDKWVHAALRKLLQPPHTKTPKENLGLAEASLEETFGLGARDY